ncbi:MAG: ATP-binding protein [Leptolyngbyaceae cyanobacterium CSU_1_3]|nr:ATP-binding protein [Leptolyngbyaceae cyanobacterium CSU_1_3]
MMTSTSELLGFSMLSRLAELRNAWEQDYSERTQGGLLALSGFEYQFLLTLLKIVHLWKASTDAERQDLETARKILAEAISDITESGRDITFTQVKRTLSASGLRSALEELWEIFQLASERTPDLAEHLRFVISGQFEGHENPQQVIQGWRTQSDGYSQQELRLFKARVRHDLVPDPRSDLSTELQVLARDENTEMTIARWLGYLLQLGSGFSPESISTFIWKELANDGSVEAFRATLARLLSLSHSRLCVIRETLGDNITLPRAKLSDLRASLFKKNITLLIGSSGSGKSALCKAGIQQDFKQNFDCLFLHASDIASFTESSDVIANRGLRRLDELLIARITQKPTLVVIDDLSDVDDQHFDAVLNLLHNTLTADPLSDVRFILVAHVDARRRIHEKISARFGNDSVYDDVELPQLPVEELVCSEALPDSVISLIQRHHEFGPALNLKLIDWLVRSAQRKQVDTAVFQSDLDLLTWFWHDHVQDSQDSSNLGQVLIRIAKELADRFTPDLPRDFDPLIGEALHTLVRRDCLRIVSGRLATTHRFVGDCARFYYLRGNRREIESEQLVEWLQNPFWVQPIRWFALQLALESSEGDTWQEFLYEALEGEHLQLLDLLLDGAILSKQPGSVLQGCPDENLPFVIERLITRLLAIATEPYPFHADGSQSTPLRTRIAIQEQITGIPKPDLWEPVWHWLLSQTPEAVIEESCIVFRAAEAWLNWSVHARSFSLRSEVANFTLDLAQAVLLPDPNPEHTWATRHRLRDFESNAFACIVFSLRIILDRSIWFLRVLAGREIVPANRLEPRQEIIGTTPSDDLLRMLRGNGVLQPGHPNGPVAEVNQQFRKFMLRQNGFYLNAVILTHPQLGVELFLALTIQPPHYLYERVQRNYDVLDRDRGTAGSDDIDVCTFKFLPLLSLLQIAEGIAISIVEILCNIVTHRNYQIDQHLEQQRSESEGNPEVEEILNSLKTDTHELTLLIGETRKQFQGGRKALYWHRNNLAPRILACLLMTLEGWLYSRPNRQELEHSISLILERTSTVAMLGVLVSLAKCDLTLLSKPLLPLISSLQLLIWLEFEQIDHGQDFGFDGTGARASLLQEDYQELLEFNRLSYRSDELQTVILHLWINEGIPLVEQSRILRDWDEHQLELIPEISKSKALRIRALFGRSNWQEKQDSEGEQVFQFIGTTPRDSEEEVKSEAALWNLHHLQIAVTCRQILDGKREKNVRDT